MASATVSAMADAIRHRGPDDAGNWVDPSGNVALGHRRLSIVDLSAAGHQPMHSPGGRYVLAFNGEIYNHLELRAALESEGAMPHWRGHSDTETMLAAFEAWGVEATLKRMVGMFAIALWDREQRLLHLARDRFGEKPLYYGWVGVPGRATFVFGSELKALRAYPGFDNEVCRGALALTLRYSYVPAPRSIYKGIYKLEPASLLTVPGEAPTHAPTLPLRTPSSHGAMELRRWWSLADVVQSSAQSPLTDEAEALSLLDDALQTAIRGQSLADVPLGAFLSGGVDSSTIVALMTQQARANGGAAVKTFTIGFEEPGFDESPYAAAVARHLGTEHHTLMLPAAEARDVIANLPAIYDEPFSDSSQVATHLVCRAARQHVTVALSGDAGDEMFGGYNRYAWGPRIWGQVGRFPYPARQAVVGMLQAMSPTGWDRLLGQVGVVRPGEKVHKLARALDASRSLDDVYANLISAWNEPVNIVRGLSAAQKEDEALAQLPEVPQVLTDEAAHMMYRDSLMYLPDDILCKVDRAAMATSLETRVPFLDHRVAELAWRMPMTMKIRNGQGKWALRQILYRHVPKDLIERPKAGFALPIGQWLRGPLRDWAESLLGEARLEQEGFFAAKPVRRTWEEHLSGRYDRTDRLWTVLMFQAWLEANG